MSASVNSFSALPELSLRDKIAQLVFVRIGSNMPPVRTVEQDVERVGLLLEECPMGGLLLFNGGPDTSKTLDRLQAASAVPLLVGSDIERGVGQQVRGCTIFPHAAAFERLGVEAEPAAVEYARLLAREARKVGIHITFAPVADVNSNPRNPIINTRAFSKDIQRAAALTRAYVAAAEGAGLFTTAKHFPGHGDTERDSHDSLPSLPFSIEQLRSRELIPFQAAIDSGCALVMTAHVAFPAIDPSGASATFSRIILQDLLRNEMGFQGVVCSDSLLMAGVRGQFEREEEMSLAVLNAGVDLLLDLEQPIRSIDYLCECVDSGKLTVERVDEAVGRLWALKQRMFGAEPNSPTSTAQAPKRSPAALAKQIAMGAIEVIGNNGCPTLPFDPDERTVAILLKPFETPIEPPEQPLGAALRERFRNSEYVQLGPRADAAAYDAAGELARGAKQIAVAIIVRPAAWFAFGLEPQQKQFVRELLSRRDDVVLACLGVPTALDEFPEAAVRICTYSDVPVSQQALVEFLCGGTEGHIASEANP
jgi:beta-glucosidase-like glycosyl hydrolase